MGVEIDLLDWDKPLSEQPAQVQAAARAAVDTHWQDMGGVPSAFSYNYDHGMTGAALMAQWLPGELNSRETSEALAKAGIKGIRYLDGNSRADGQGSSNYVIFDGKDITITHENGEEASLSEPRSANVSQNGGESNTSFSIGERFEADPERMARQVFPIEISSDKLPGERKDWRAAVHAVFESLRGGELTNGDSGQKVFFNAESKRESVSKARNEPAHRAAKEAKEIVENSLFIGHSPENKGKGDHIRGFDYFAIPVSIDGAERIAWFNTKRRAGEQESNRGQFYQFGLLAKQDARASQSPVDDPQVASVSKDKHSNAGHVRTVAEFVSEVKNAHPNGKSFVSSPSLSLGPAALAATLQGDAISRIRNPESRAIAYSRMSREMERLRLAGERLELETGGKRLRKSLKKEAAMREALRTQELEEEALARHEQVLAADDMTKLKSMPLHALFADPKSNLRGRIMSKSAAMKRGADFFDPGKHGDYDGADGVSRSVFGGARMPDQAAQEAFDEGLFPEVIPMILALDRLLSKLGEEMDFRCRLPASQSLVDK